MMTTNMWPFSTIALAFSNLAGILLFRYYFFFVLGISRYYGISRKKEQYFDISTLSGDEKLPSNDISVADQVF